MWNHKIGVCVWSEALPSETQLSVFSLFDTNIGNYDARYSVDGSNASTEFPSTFLSVRAIEPGFQFFTVAALMMASKAGFGRQRRSNTKG